MAMSDNVIEVQNLTKRYGQTTVVKGISFSVGRGEIFGLLGPNGSGKTTTILMLMGLTEISDGQVRLLGRDPAREPLAIKRRTGYLPDAVGFYDNFSAADNLRYTARLNGFTRAEREGRIKSALADVGLADVPEKQVATFSHGMRQRLGVAEILMKGAEVALLDEPTSGLDPQSQMEFLEIIRNFKNKNVSVLLSSHLLAQVQSVCDRVALFNKGSIVLTGTVSELAQQILGGGFHVEVEAVGLELAEPLRRVPGVSAVEVVSTNHFRLLADRDVRPDAASAVVAAGGRLLRLGVAMPSLEAIYMAYFDKIAARTMGLISIEAPPS
jgi:ABC-2 type transport system ATP-binding protein